MQIHELTRRQPLNEVDLVGPNGLLAGIKNTMAVAKQPGGMQAIGKHLTPGTYSSIPDALTGDFAKRIQAVKNSADIKQVAANMQAQWDQHRKQLSPMSAITPQQQQQQQQLKSKLLAKKVSGAPAPAKLALPEAQQSSVAGGLIQLTDWYKQTMIPKDYASHAAEYLKEPLVQATLKKIADAEKLGDADRLKIQGPEFVNLVAQTSAKSQQITAKNPQLSASRQAATPGRTAPKASSVQAAQMNVAKVASLTPAQIAQIEKIMGALPAATAQDPTTRNYLHALGFNTK